MAAIDCIGFGTYQLLEQFDAYFCDLGRITIQKDVIFQVTDIRGDKRIYFKNSDNCLPPGAEYAFLTCKRKKLD